MKKFALVSAQGTACAETVLLESEYTPEMRARIEAQIDPANSDAPIPGTWTDVTDNDAFADLGTHYGYAVGKEGEPGPRGWFPTLAGAESYVEFLAQGDPVGVERGDYYIDGPDCDLLDCFPGWSGHPDPKDPDNYWIDDVTGERVNAQTGKRD
jgi:hypothetical protein